MQKQKTTIVILLIVTSLIAILPVFVIDFAEAETLFQFGYETGDMSIFDANSTIGGYAMNVIQTPVYGGYYAGNYTITTAGTSGCFNRIELTDSETEIFAFGAFYFDDLLTTSGRAIRFMFFYSDTGAALCNAEIYNTAGSLNYSLVTYSNGAFSRAYSTTFATADCWNLIQMKLTLSSADGTTDGEAVLYLNGTQILEVTGIDTDTFRNLRRCYWGRGRSAPTGVATDTGMSYIDYIELSDQYINVEESVEDPPYNLDYLDLITYYQNLAVSYPTWVSVGNVFGLTGYKTFEEREQSIIYVGNATSGKRLMFTTTTHGAEYYCAFAVREFVTWLLTNNTDNSNAILQNMQIVIIPAVNLDQWAVGSGGQNTEGRKNKNDTAPSIDGVDLARNFATGWSQGVSSDIPTDYNYCGENAYSESESKALTAIWDLYSGTWVGMVDFHLYLDPQFLYATGYNQTEHATWYSEYSTIAPLYGINASVHLPHLYNTAARGMIPEDFNEYNNALAWCMEMYATAPNQATIEGLLCNQVIAIALTYNSIYGGDYVPPAEEEEETPPVTGSVTTDWMVFALLALLSVVSVLLMLKGFPMLNFVFGTLTVGIAVYTASLGLMMGGYMQLIASVMGVLTMLVGAIRLRGG